MKVGNIPNTLFVKNRKKLGERLKDHSIVIVNSADRMPRSGDQMFPYRQHSDMYYLTGIEQEESILVLLSASNDKNGTEAILYILQPKPEVEVWEGKKLTIEEARYISGIDRVKYVEDFEKDVLSFARTRDIMYLNRNEHSRYESSVETRDDRFIKEIKERFPLHRLERLAPIVSQLRQQKEEEEIQQIRAACRITSHAFEELVRTIEPGMYEYELEAIIESVFLRKGAQGRAFETIVAGGKNACYLHYNKNNCKLVNTDLVLIDFGAEYGNYASDCTRTIPVHGTFSDRQKSIYDACYHVYQYVKTIVKPGTTLKEIHANACMRMERELMNIGLLDIDEISQKQTDKPAYTKYFMHGIGHFLGLDTHDVGSKDDILLPGMVVTCEPGIYVLEEGIGVRIETDLLITSGGNIDLFDKLPTSSEEIEAYFVHIKENK